MAALVIGQVDAIKIMDGKTFIPFQDSELCQGFTTAVFVQVQVSAVLGRGSLQPVFLTAQAQACFV